MASELHVAELQDVHEFRRPLGLTDFKKPGLIRVNVKIDWNSRGYTNFYIWHLN